ncbi:MAG: exo-alpha-sialidase [Candidatus Viridilinea halotolerans]|uniref:Exo-alpha-sialidase n=1 Tax=Candidatus Viridilinea halotolerans TaxID=2491704 RepID=A0A426TYB6_9CHLR|nr:MAG: exo-alpha-sialidase [Candidatus Viridilinea halotolerans]
MLLNHKHTIFLALFLLTLLALPQPLWADEEQWRGSVEVAPDKFGWFPDLAVDLEGTIHVIWGSGAEEVSETGLDKESIDVLSYRALRQGRWTAIEDIARTAKGGYTVRNSLVVNIDGRIQALVRYETDVKAVSAPADGAGSAQYWTAPQRLGSSYYNALAADSRGHLHMLYQELVITRGEQANLASEVFYRRSTDGGQTWTIQQNIAYLPGGDERMQIKVDHQDRIHVVWDHGSDWYLGIDNPAYGVYRRSDDGGQTWQPAIALGIADEPTVQTALGLTLEGNPLAVYRSANGEHVYAQYSPDGGVTWQFPAIIPGVRARAPIERGLDSYSLAVDSANRLHLLMVGFPTESPAGIPMVLHLIWDGQGWSAPEVVYQSEKRPMWPRAVVAQGNELHAVWFTYTAVSDWGERRIWHNSRPLSSPQVAASPPRPLPTAATTYRERPANVEEHEVAVGIAPTAQPWRDIQPPTAINVWRDVVAVGLGVLGVLSMLVVFTILTLRRRAREEG